MLNAETKRHIDNARDILVGVVPNPTSQIDQITNALIYKFMDDMDQAAIKVGAEPSFFIKDLEQYAWSRLMSDRLGNQERMNLYAEALTKFATASQLPQLFRDIFKSSFLPYRSPEVLGLFLKEINYFDYAHPEELGNAYEYLLQIMGSQGDAGQFRTPRHIIDFVVDVVNPTKDDKVLDPACGTAGFLISAYKHILEQHDGKDDTKKQEKPLTPEERKKLFANFEGYDIDPSMVRIAQVNMYLHQFKNPKVAQYDSLSQEERWSDKYDVVLANPPFMSPRGGIRPHNKFSIQSTRSEVLFVDYIMNHLRPKGRAGIIVPEGIIFKSDTATKQLRKNLVEDGLYAVVSLPSGVFNPYAGVKTSILLFDNARAKEVDELLFVKIENDGHDLGAQRRPINKNDLPEALKVIEAWRNGEKLETTIAQWVPRAKVAETGDYNLSAAKYIEGKTHVASDWPLVELGEVIDVLDNLRRPITKSDRKPGKYPYYGATGVLDYIDGYIFEERLVLIGEDGAKWESGDKTAFIADGQYWVNNHAHVVRPKTDVLIDTYLVACLNYLDLSGYITGVTVPKLNQEKLRSIKIPLPPLEVQQQIVAELDGYQKIIDGARQIVDNWKPSFVTDPAWPTVRLGDHIDINNGYVLTDFDDDGRLACIKVSDMNLAANQYEITTTSHWLKDINRQALPLKSIVFPKRGAAIATNKKRITTIPCLIDNNCMAITSKDTSVLLPEYLFNFMLGFDLRSISNSAGIALINNGDISGVTLPLPPLEVQQQIVDTLEVERAHVESVRTLIDLYTQKTQATIAMLWTE